MDKIMRKNKKIGSAIDSIKGDGAKGPLFDEGLEGCGKARRCGRVESVQLSHLPRKPRSVRRLAAHRAKLYSQ
ncbi:MAG: hypothetical protein ACHQAY_20480 [Hyphomicrobiales bacterium]